MKKLLLVALLLLSKAPLFAQKPAETLPANDTAALLRGSGRWDGRNIQLRWAPTTPGAWRSYNFTGYIVERTWYDTTLRHSGKPERLTAQALKPLNLAGWEELFKTSKGKFDENYIAIAAQCLHGKTPAGAARNLMDQAADLSNRHSFALFAADVSPLVARASGLGLLDARDVAAGRVYVYKIFPASKPSNGYRADTTFVFVRTDGDAAATVLPKITVDDSFEGEKTVTLGWSKPLYAMHYSAYFIEKSSDGRTFEPLNKLPFVQLTDEQIGQSHELIRFTDSLDANYRPAFYRVIGLTPFGERSQPGPAVRLMGRDRTPPNQPREVRAEHVGGARVRVTWRYDGDLRELKGFKIGRSSTAAEGFVELTKTPVSTLKMEFFDENMPAGTNYYVVAAIDTADNGAASLVAFAALVDTVPPAKPVRPAGSIDTNGVVRLHWPLGKESDVSGYRVWSANQRDHVFVCLTPTMVKDTVWRDTIRLRTLTETVYYKIQAVDINSNASAHSEAVELRKPDKIAPVSALMTGFRVKKDGIELEFQPSTSHDVVRHELLRRQEGAAQWEVVADLKDTRITSFFDVKAKPGALYHYNIVAIDDAGLRSELQQPIEARMIDQRPPAGVSNLSARADDAQKVIALAWLSTVKGPHSVLIFRAENGGPLRSIARVEPPEKAFLDKTARPGKQYEYSARVQYDDGQFSPFSDLAKAALIEK